MIRIRRQAETRGGVEAAFAAQYGAGASSPRLAAVAAFACGAFNRRAASISLSATASVGRLMIARRVSTASAESGRRAPV